MEKVKRLENILIKNINLYFHMYSSARKVGALLRSFDGYNATIQKIFFISSQSQEAKIIQEGSICKEFWMFRPEEERPEYFGEEDLNLYNALQNYSLKMERSLVQVSLNFSSFETKRMSKLSSELGGLEVKSKEQNKTKKDTLNLLVTRKRHNQERREKTMSKLEIMGVNFDISQRNREIVIR